MLHSAHTLGISLSVFSSQQQADVVCAVNLRGTCCTNFMRGQQKQERVITSSSSNVNTCGCVKKKHCNTCPCAARSRHLALFFVSNLFPTTKKYLVASLPLMESVLLRVDGLAADGKFLCCVVGAVSHRHSLGVVGHSLRLLAVLCGEELKRPR